VKTDQGTDDVSRMGTTLPPEPWSAIGLTNLDCHPPVLDLSGVPAKRVILIALQGANSHQLIEHLAQRSRERVPRPQQPFGDPIEGRTVWWLQIREQPKDHAEMVLSVLEIGPFLQPLTQDQRLQEATFSGDVRRGGTVPVRQHLTSQGHVGIPIDLDPDLFLFIEE
jgi:hypothetical protein